MSTPNRHTQTSSTRAGVVSPPSPPPDDRPRFLSEADCRDIAQRLARVARGGGITTAEIFSTWTGNVRWARNQISTSGEVRNNNIRVIRDINGASNDWLLLNETTDAALVAAVRRAERMADLTAEHPESDLIARLHTEPTSPTAPLFFETTYQLDADRRTDAAIALARAAAEAGMLSAGYIQVGAHSMAIIDTVGHVNYCAYTTAQYSVTVRDPTGTGSGWAGVDWPDWSRIDGPRLTAIALEKCLTSRNPVAVEPGRYTTILEPQAVCDLVSPLMESDDINVNRGVWEPTRGQFASHPLSWRALKGQRVMDARITISADPLDPDLAFLPFDLLAGSDVFLGDRPLNYETYHPFLFVEQGVLRNLAYDRDFAIGMYGQNLGLPNSGAFRMSGGETSMEEMIATTKRGILVTRFDRVEFPILHSPLLRGYTRDGLWLIENGKIAKAVENFIFTESPLIALNSVEQLGAPQRTFRPKIDSIFIVPQPVIVPPLKIKDFNFTSLADAI